MSHNNTLTNKVNNLIDSNIESNFPQKFDYMSNIKVNIIDNYIIKINIKYNDKYGGTNTIDFKIRTIDENKNIILKPMGLIGRVHIKLLENNGPFIVQR